MPNKEGMLIGTATASYQVEGYRSIKEDKTDWGDAARRGRVPYVGTGPDHWRFYKRDLELMGKLGLNAYRFSIEPARIMPSEGKLDKGALLHYIDMLKVAKRNGITPIVNLSHYTLPKYVADRGGFANEGAVLEFFKEYGEVIASAGFDFDYVLTINEPNVLAFAGYLMGLYPPFRCSPIAFERAWRAQTKVHKILYDMLKPYNYNISFAASMVTYRWLFGLSPVLDELWNFNHLNNLKNKLDFISVNYYFDINLVNAIKNVFTLRHPFTNPAGLSDIMSRLHKRFRKPILISENGMHTSNDERRVQYLKRFIKIPYEAADNGAEILGYLHWSFIDNYEWIFGYEKNYGIVGFDPVTKRRVVRNSAKLLGNVARSGLSAIN